MKVPLSFQLAAVLAIVNGVAAERTLYIAESCTKYKDMVIGAVESARYNARQAWNALIPCDPPNQTLQSWAERLLDADDAKHRADAIERYKAITKDIEFHPDGELWDETKAGQWSDIIIYCTWDRFVEETVDGIVTWHDLPNQVLQTAKSRAEFFPSDASAYMLEAKMTHMFDTDGLNFVELHHGVVGVSSLQLNPNTLDKFLENWNLDTDRSSSRWFKVGDDQNQIEYAKAAAEAYKLKRKKPWIDRLSRSLDSILLHEISHAIAAGSSSDLELPGDVDGESTYGWINALRWKTSKNADNIEAFAAVVKLFNLGFTIDDDGTYHGHDLDNLPVEHGTPDCSSSESDRMSTTDSFMYRDFDEDGDGLLDAYSGEENGKIKRSIFRIRGRRSSIFLGPVT
ncbi:hypothetical protein EG327_002359 [Venturia inaequalis]|uniref:Uncharacterized protein n=1 Tax=Venturia inaequalis TaxID=5025 RepID=A0A8H3VGJ1_VENIN|nr:hypothetical protein EG327_002359 [Venturia inaequalis]